MTETELQQVQIRTSDRIAFKRCRRRWNFTSELRNNLVPQTGVSAPLWFGTGVHFALEDFHGFQLWPTAQEAFTAYVEACTDAECPPEIEKHVELAHQMLDHYADWCSSFHSYKMYQPVVDGCEKSGCEVKFHIHLPHENFAAAGYDVYYVGTVDSIFIDPITGKLLIGEYKTAANIDVAKLETDDQISSYLWALTTCLPNEKIEGVSYRQLRKQGPVEPQVLVSGELSVNKSQRTTYHKYRKALERLYPGVSVDKLSLPYQQMLAHLAANMNFEGDNFISHRLAYRSPAAIAAQRQKIYMDCFEMLNNPAITTNPTRDCAWDCNFREICLAMDDAADWEEMLRLSFGPRENFADQWEERLKIPTTAARHTSTTLPDDVGKTWKEFKNKRGLVLNASDND